MTEQPTLVVLCFILYGMSSLICFPLLIEEVAKRIGDDYLVLGTGMIFSVAQIFSAVLVYALGIVMNGERKIQTLYALTICIFVAALSNLLVSYSDWNRDRLFGIDSRNTLQIVKRLTRDERGKDDGFWKGKKSSADGRSRKGTVRRPRRSRVNTMDERLVRKERRKRNRTLQSGRSKRGNTFLNYATQDN
jgi:hypothetical protein